MAGKRVNAMINFILSGVMEPIKGREKPRNQEDKEDLDEYG